MIAGALVSAHEVELEHEPVDPSQVVAGSPTTGYAALVEDGTEIGVWEMTPGAMSDTEVSEVFVVVAGAATVEFVSPALPTITLAPGSIVKLDAGMQTVWTVTETLRKVFIER